ncbi:hypothetical protein BES34_013025 [Leptospira inadai serovar Lyme]|uniref:Uncharacterized protein n=1 Tax=Leptospira inadai serovar Lyme TaxID=293084 RepID=A0ABX4YHA7_9LEPT|nr:hypothetical protein BES34_020825 [Leptospira inadai serovar Lyme]PNV74651.1 hypothetical protein BES34_013025 [Leptospira inadai serovar Lyme]
MFCPLHLPGLAVTQSPVLVDWAPRRLELASPHRAAQSQAFTLLMVAMLALKFSLRVLDF